jgi:hypothetical protein
MEQNERPINRSTDDMTEAEKRKHAKAIKMCEKELGLEDDEDEEEQQEEEEEEEEEE